MISAVQPPLSEFMKHGPYVGYSYSYPHKTAYRRLDPPCRLTDIWANENQQSLFLYVHIPFCEVRCGFCNLFTFSQPDENLASEYVQSLRGHAQVVRRELPEARFTRLAIGGGTPSYLNDHELVHLLATLSDHMQIDGHRIPISFEVSPSTLTHSKLLQLSDFGIDRISMGVQSFSAHDTASMGRPQSRSDVYQAIELIRSHSIETLNLDLIYGAESQTMASWNESIDEILRIRPEEIYLYPLYVRPLTGLAKINRLASDARPMMYRAARDRLLESGYEQLSMRMFQLPKSTPSSYTPDYQCQRDGMIGLGCGARSYTSTLHYGTNYAVKQPSILRLINDYIRTNPDDWACASHGIKLDIDEHRRRYAILSLLLVQGMDCAQYIDLFGESPMKQLPGLSELCDTGLAVLQEDRLTLTQKGIEWSDTIGPWLYSHDVRTRMAEFEWTG